MLRAVKLFKNLLLFIPLTLIFYPFSKAFIFLYHFNSLLLWIYKNKGQFKYSDYFSLIRDYDKRYKHYDFIVEHLNLSDKKITYLEFGVAKGHSFKWWLEKNKNPLSGFWGFDTFEGLPENWGAFYSKGDMSYTVPDFNDDRAKFVKGLFQDTLFKFIQTEKPSLAPDHIKIIHMDADLYSATAFALAMLYPYLNKGDIIMFDEFNVPMHEYKAYKEFTENFYVKLIPLSAVNNFYQLSFIVDK